MQDETMDRFLGLMTEIRMKRGGILIPYGKVDDSLYVVAEGIIRSTYFDGPTEKTFAFASEGTVLLDYHGYYMCEPAVFQRESCGKSVIMKISRTNIDELLRESVDFTNWMSSIHTFQAYLWEKKAVLIAGTAKERLEAMLKNRPEIIEKIPLRIIASYIGVTPQYVSMIRARLRSEYKKQSGE
jgi:CRP-like cAMP-binding protein